MLLAKDQGKSSVEAKTAEEELAKEKIEKASQLVSQILSDEGPHAVLFSGGPASCALLHIIREVMNQKIPVFVCHVDLLRNQHALYQYLEKMKKLWGFDLIRERNRHLLDLRDLNGDWEEFYYTHTREILYDVAQKCGVRFLLLPQHKESELERCQEIRLRSGFRFFEMRPLIGFTEKEIATLIWINNIPICPVFKGTLERVPKVWLQENRKRAVTLQTGMETEEKEMASKLKSLGYL